MSNKEEIKNKREDLSKKATEQQQRAANPAHSVWVEASAGTGKTKVLTDRVLRLLLSGVEPQKLLCLTYTKAAAVQMYDRISEYLGKWAVMSDEALDKDIKDLLGKAYSPQKKEEYMRRARILFADLLDTPGGIKINTIHSFCQEVLKRFPLESGVSPYFNLLDDRGKETALAAIKSEFLSGKYDKDSDVEEAITFFTHNSNEDSFSKVMEHITDNYTKIIELFEKYKGLRKFLPVLAEHLGVRDDDSEEMLKLSLMQTVDWAEMKQNMAAWRYGGKTDKGRCDILGEIMSHTICAEDYDKYQAMFLTKNNTVMVNLAAVDAQKVDSEIVERVRKEAERIQEMNWKLVRLKLYMSTKNFLIIAESLNEKYSARKQQMAVLDYDDMISQTRRLLSNPSTSAWVLYKLDGGIDHILLDEAQDTSPGQWDIIKYLSREFFDIGASDKNRTIFSVGDRKQSIFSFQGADPDKLDDMYEHFKGSGGHKFETVNLDVSFRSAPAILQSVNKVFSALEISKGVVSKGKTVNHDPYRVGEFGHVEIWSPFIAEKNTKVQDDSYSLPPMEMEKRDSVRTKLAEAIAERIKTMVNETCQSDHPLNFKDFMVLVRQRDAFVEEFIRACKKMGVDICGADKMALTDQIAVQDLISLGKFLLLPNDDLSLAETLKSPLFGLDDDDLIKICRHKNHQPLWTCLNDTPEYHKIYELLQYLLSKLDYMRPYELYNYMLSTKKGRQKFINRIGVEVEDALDEFMNLTIDFEQQNTPSLQGFIEWMSKSKVIVKRQMESKEINAVRLMTVHGSKGLQAAVVFLPDTIKVKDSLCEQRALFDDKYVYYPLNRNAYEDNCLKAKDYNDMKADEEHRRLMYVGLTRAEDQMIICGYSNDDKIKPTSWFSLCEKMLVEGGYPADKIYRITTDEGFEKEKKNEQIISAVMPEMENWMNTDAPDENAASKPYTPSNLTEDKDEPDSVSPLQDAGNFYRRGTIIHKLLQFLPQNTGDKEQTIDIFLQKNAHDFSKEQCAKIKSEVMALLNNPEFTDLFGEKAQAEVPIVGEVDGIMISAQLDKLLVLPDKVMIVDFKTNQPPAKDVASTSPNYIRQLGLYAKLLQRIYPNLPVETYILWTNEARLMRVA